MRRAYDLLRGYVNREWDRMQGLEREAATSELDAFDKYKSQPTSPRVPQPDKEIAMDAETAAKILGVEVGAHQDEVERAYARLSKRCDLSNFPAESFEFQAALEIHRRIHRAYTVLTENRTITEKRFGDLEIS